MEKTSTRGAAGFATPLVTSLRQTGQQNLRNLENRLRLEPQRIVSSTERPLKCVFAVVVYRIALPPPLNNSIILGSELNYTGYYPFSEVSWAPVVASKNPHCARIRRHCFWLEQPVQ